MATATAAKKKPTTRRKPVPAPQVEGSQDDALAALAALGPRGHQMIPVGNLVPHPRNPRQDLGDLTELTASVQASGVLQNLTVVPDPGEDGRFRIVIGHRRAAAAQAAGLADVPATVDPDMSERDQLALMLAENVHRADLTVVEEADGYQALLDEGLSRAQLAKRVGTPRSTVDSRLRLAALPAPAKAKVHAGQATLEDAFALDDDTLTPEQRAELIGHLGTSSFRWRIDQARQAAKLAGVREAMVQALTEVGASETDDTAALRDTHRFGHEYTTPEKIRQDGGPAWFWRTQDWGTGVAVYLPRPADLETPADPEREERDRAQSEALAAVQTAANLRGAFVADFVAGRRKLDANAAHAVVVAFVAASLAWDGATDDRAILELTRRWASALLGSNKSIDLDAVDLTAVTTIGDLIGVSTPERVMLAAFASAMEGDGTAVSGNRWSTPALMGSGAWAEGWGDEPDVVAWYRLLDALGYEPSPAELEALARGADVEPDEDEDDAEADG